MKQHMGELAHRLGGLGAKGEAAVLSLKFIEKVSLALYQGTTLVVP
jgi:hypothetical protein